VLVDRYTDGQLYVNLLEELRLSAAGLVADRLTRTADARQAG
jgi:hypothetical protein